MTHQSSSRRNASQTQLVLRMSALVAQHLHATERLHGINMDLGKLLFPKAEKRTINHHLGVTSAHLLILSPCHCSKRNLKVGKGVAKSPSFQWASFCALNFCIQRANNSKVKKRETVLFYQLMEELLHQLIYTYIIIYIYI